MIAIPQCIWCNFTSLDDYCRWAIYDDAKKIESPGYHRKIYNESFGYKKIAYLTIYRDGKTILEVIEDVLLVDLETITTIAKTVSFIDHTEEEKEYIRQNYADHPVNHSLMYIKPNE